MICREDEAIAAITSSPSFKEQIRAACRVPSSPSADCKPESSAEAQGGTSLPEVPICTSKGKRSARRSERHPGESPYQPGTPDAKPTSARLPEASPAGKPVAKLNTEAASGDGKSDSSRCQHMLEEKRIDEGGKAAKPALATEVQLTAVEPPQSLPELGQAAETILTEQCTAEQDEMAPEAADAMMQPPADCPSNNPSSQPDPDNDCTKGTTNLIAEDSASRQLLPQSDRLETGQLANSAAEASASSPSRSKRPSRRASQGVAQLLQSLRDAPRVQQELAKAAKAAAAMRERAREAAAAAAGKEERIKNKRAKKEELRKGEADGDEVGKGRDASAKKPRLGMHSLSIYQRQATPHLTDMSCDLILTFEPAGISF